MTLYWDLYVFCSNDYISHVVAMTVHLYLAVGTIGSNIQFLIDFQIGIDYY